MLNRRDLLATGLAAGAFSFGGVRASAFAAPEGADAGDYRALVCVFLTGGLDSYDTLIPTDTGRHRQWREARGALTDSYDRSAVPRRIEDLYEIGTDADGAAYGLAPQMPQTAAMVRDGRAAVIAGVGPLQGPVTPRELEARSVPLPPQLFSHADQRAYWRTLAPAGDARTGWGGRLIHGLGQEEPLAALSGGRDEGFTMGPAGAGAVLGNLKPLPAFGTHDVLWGDAELAEMFRDHIAAVPEGAGLLERDFAAGQERAAGLSRRIIALMKQSDAGAGIAQGAARDSLHYGLAIVARMIGLRKQTGVARQLFYVEMNGFDTHRGQADRIPLLQAELDDGLGRFTAWLDAAGLGEAVTTFTASDFGRTLTPNGSGTDHGWGGHQIVMGGAVRGGLYGAMPPPETGHPMDAGRGRAIPTLAVEQTAVPLARWLGLPQSELASVFPYANRFDLDAVPLMRS